MIPKQKRLNRLSDMAALGRRMSDEEELHLQTSRLFRSASSPAAGDVSVFRDNSFYPSRKLFSPPVFLKQEGDMLNRADSGAGGLHSLLAPKPRAGMKFPSIWEPGTQEKILLSGEERLWDYLKGAVRRLRILFRIAIFAARRIDAFFRSLLAAAYFCRLLLIKRIFPFIANISKSATPAIMALRKFFAGFVTLRIRRRVPSSAAMFLPAGAQINLLPLPKSRFNFALPRFSAKVMPSLAVFTAFSLLVLSVFPFLQGLESKRKSASQVLGAAVVAYQDFAGAGGALLSSDFQAADSGFKQAYKGFEQADSLLNNLSSLIPFIPQTKEGQKLILSAEQASLAMQYLTGGMQGLLATRLTSGGLQVKDDEQAVNSMSKSLDDFRIAESYLLSASASLEQIDIGKLPAEFQQKVSDAADTLKTLMPGLQRLTKIQEIFYSLAAGDSKTYLILFQNNRELRATGGFIGTYGILTLEQGKIKELKIETIYNPDGQLKQKIASPGPLQRNLAKNWALRDSNWFFDFSKSAAKAREFFKLETGRDADAVLAMTPDIFVRLLSLSGPIFMPGYNVELRPDNFVDEVQRQTSEIYDRKINQPKKFLADFAPLLLDRLSQLDGEGWLNFLDIVIQSLDRKDILLSSTDAAQQDFFESFNWAGTARSTNGDYLAVVNSNVGAGKTDQDINQKISLGVKILSDGSAVNTLTINRMHNPGQEKDFPVNVDFVRIYVPAESKLLSATGFDSVPFLPSSAPDSVTDPDLNSIDKTTLIDAVSNTLVYEESEKIVFANWIILPPGQNREIKIEYRTPLQYPASGGNSWSYSLLAQKQPGAPPTEFESTLQFPDSSEPLWHYPEPVKVEKNSAVFSDNLETDKVWGVVFK